MLVWIMFDVFNEGHDASKGKRNRQSDKAQLWSVTGSTDTSRGVLEGKVYEDRTEYSDRTHMCGRGGVTSQNKTSLSQETRRQEKTREVYHKTSIIFVSCIVVLSCIVVVLVMRVFNPFC
jgi:hypothetical protein